MATNKKKKFISLKEKIDVVKEFSSGRPVADIAQQFGIGKTQAYRILRNKDELQNTKTPLYCKVLTTKGKYPEIDTAIFDWFCSIRSFSGSRRPLPVSKSIIQARAVHEATKRGIASFNASDGWLWRWCWRFGIANSVRLHGEAAQVDLKVAEERMEELRRQIVVKGYKHSNIFNMDETGLFYQL